LDVSSTTQCVWKTNSASTQLLRDASVIIWDEISIQSRHAVEAVDRAFQDLMDNEEPFGGKMIIFGGDFRQTLPVVKQGKILDQAEKCMINSPLWTNVYIFQLTQNM
jgi:hypothetical protein